MKSSDPTPADVAPRHDDAMRILDAVGEALGVGDVQPLFGGGRVVATIGGPDAAFPTPRAIRMTLECVGDPERPRPPPPESPERELRGAGAVEAQTTVPKAGRAHRD